MDALFDVGGDVVGGDDNGNEHDKLRNKESEDLFYSFQGKSTVKSVRVFNQAKHGVCGIVKFAWPDIFKTGLL
jgi:hypothetical protein